MKTMTIRWIGLFPLILSIVVSPVVYAGQSQDDVLVQQLVVLTAGSEKEINFYIDGVFDFEQFGPMALFVILAVGEADMLTAELTIDPEEELGLGFTDVIEGTIVGGGVSAAPAFTPVYGDSVEIPVGSGFGFLVLGALITKKDTSYPVGGSIPCSILFSLTEAEENAEG